MATILTEEQKTLLDTKFNRWRADAEKEYKAKVRDWDDADAYFENDQAPPDFSTQHRDALANANDPTKGDVHTKQYVIFNKTLISHEIALGDFIDAERNLLARGRSIKDRRFGRVVQTELTHVFDQNMTWEEVIIPAVDSGRRRGNHWITVSYNPFVDLPLGKIEYEEISCRDVMVDPRSRKYYYQDAQYYIHVRTYEFNEANLKFKYLLPEGVEFTPDNQADLFRGTSTRTTYDRSVTIYHYYYWEWETRFYYYDPEGVGTMNKIDEETFMAFSKNPNFANKVFQVNEKIWYKAMYNIGKGTISNDEDEIQSQSIFPVVYIRSENQLYALGSAKYENNLQDLINVLVSVLLEHAKNQSGGYVNVDPASWRQYGDQIQEGLRSRGRKAIPAEKFMVAYPPQLTEGIVMLFQLVSGAMEDVQRQHAASKGEMPRERIATETVQLILAQDKKSHGRMDVNVKWAMSQMARATWKIIKRFWTEQHWARLTDNNTKDSEYVPMNMVVTEGEYVDLLMEISDMQLYGDETQQEAEEFKRKLMLFQREFEKQNEVRHAVETVYIVDKRRMTEDQLFAQLEESQMTMAQFLETFKPIIEKVPVVIINDFSTSPDLDIIWTVDFNADQDRQVKANKAIMAFDRKTITGKRLNEALEFPNPDQLWEEAVKENNALQIGEQIVQDPELYKAAVALIQGTAKVVPAEEGSEGDGKEKKNGQKEEKAEA